MMPQSTQHKASRGQSLVEVALFFPIFIILLAGVVEVSNIIVTQNRVTSAARAATRFAADGGQDEGMVTVVLNTVTQTLETSPDVWDVWSIRGTVNANGDGFEPGTWQFAHIYGISATTRFSDVNELEIQAQVLQELQTDEYGNSSQPTIAGGLQIVGTYAIHDIDSILGLNALPQYASVNSARELSVMRITGKTLNATAGCTAFPIAIPQGVRSVDQPQYDSIAALLDNSPNPLPGYNSFPAHTANKDLYWDGQDDAEEGDLFLVYGGVGNDKYSWLRWNEYILNPPATTLNNSLSWPGDSADYTDHGDNGTAPGYSHAVRGFLEAGDPTNQEMRKGDWVAASSASIGDVTSILNEHITQKRVLRLIIWDNAGAAAPPYKITNFAAFRVIGFNSSQNFLLLEFIRKDESCGQ